MIIVRICTEYLQMIYQNQFVSNLVSTRGLKSEKEHLTVTLIQQLLIVMFFPIFNPLYKTNGFPLWESRSEHLQIFLSFIPINLLRRHSF